VSGDEPEEVQEAAETIALEVMDVDGVEDVRVEGNLVEVYAELSDLKRVRDALIERGYNVTTAEKTYVPKSTVSLSEKDTIQVLKLLERIEELDDVQKTYSNLEIPDSVLAALEQE
jgi:transcriptional/translational regulatory protein YebC/TACO1